MTKKIKISLYVVFALALALIAVVLTGCGSVDSSIIVKNDMIKTEYVLGEELEITGGILDYVSKGKTTHVSITKDMISNFSTKKLGSYSMIVTYKGETTTVPYTVNEGFSLSKLYYTENILPACWIKFDTQTSKMYFAQRASAPPETFEQWTTYGNILTYTKTFENGKQKIEILNNSSESDETYTITTLSNTSFALKNGDQVVNFNSVNEFDMSKIYHTTENYGIWIKFDTQTSKMYFAQGTSTIPATNDEWTTYGSILTYTKIYKNGKLYLKMTTSDETTTIIETINDLSLTLTSGGASINLTAIN